MRRDLQFSVIAALCLCASSCKDNRLASPTATPTIEIGEDKTGRVGDSVLVRLTPYDSRGSVASPWTYTVAWGDGTSSSGTLITLDTITAAHVYGREGQYGVRATIADRNGLGSTDSVTASIGAAIVMIGAGDIGECGLPYASQTAAILDTTPGTVFTLGDNAYPNGSASDFANCYDPHWGRHKQRTRPTIGNHEYNTPNACGYFGYFGAAAGDPATGYYSYELGDWHIVVLNSNLPVSPGSTQEQWLRADLRAHPAGCTLAMWHHALFSSGSNHASGSVTTALWDALYEAGADVVLVGHEHNYERFAPQTSTGAPDSQRGIREFVAGMGGGGSYSLGTPIANSEARSGEHGLLKLTLHRSSYVWQFVPITPGSYADSGSATCH